MFAQDLNTRWKILCRKIKQEVEDQADRYTLIYLPHPVIVPGGRFREIYYWDSYWIIRGLIQSEMYSTAKGVLANFVHLIRQFGMIPNGGRSYYLNRSQPPMFIQMVREYVNATGDCDFVKSIIGNLAQFNCKLCISILTTRTVFAEF
jgi:alpha,alpha-trehalase